MTFDFILCISISNMKEVRVKLIGGLGNQIFGYIAGYWFSQKLNANLLLDFSEISHKHSKFDITSFKLNAHFVNMDKRNHFFRNLRTRATASMDYRFPKSFQRWDLFTHRYNDQGFDQNNFFQSDKDKITLRGYFQDLRYFDKYFEDNYSLQLNTKSDNFKSHVNEIQQSNQLAIHIRRGDFLSNKQYHGVLDFNWYLKVLSMFEDLTPNPTRIWVFSNDIAWCRTMFSGINKLRSYDILYVTEDQLRDPAEHLMLFSMAPNKVCANSTFSIISAKIGQGLVFAPTVITRSQEQTGLAMSYPSNWIKVDPVWEGI